MTDFPRPTRDALTPEQEALWRNIVEGPRSRNMKEPPKSLPGPFGPWLQLPEFGRVAAEMGEVLRMRSILPGDLREIAILAAGVHWKAEFEFYAHANMARAEGLDEAIIEALREGEEPPYNNDQQRLVHQAALHLLADGDLPRPVRDRLADELGWPATVELVALVGFYCMVSFTLNAFDVGLPEGMASFWPR